MRQVPWYWSELVAGVNRWETVVQWTNTGGRTEAEWTTAEVISGTVTQDSTQQCRWATDLQILAPFGRDAVNPYTTRLRIFHGTGGVMLPMGRYKVTSVTRQEHDRDPIQVAGQSYEIYLQRARFITAKTIRRNSAGVVLEQLIREVLPDAQVSWLPGVDRGALVPQMLAERDRWGLIDGSSGSTSIARALGARVYAGPTGEFIVAPTPSLEDPPVWEARSGEGGVLLSHSETLEDSDVYNVVVASGSSTDGSITPFKPGIAMDMEPTSLTYALRTPGQGGIGKVPRFYSSPLLTSTAAAERTARSMLAQSLGLKQQIAFSSLHDPAKEAGDVGIVSDTDVGNRLVILDSVTHDLQGAPLTGQTRTTATRLAGVVTDVPEEVGDVDDTDDGSSAE